MRVFARVDRLEKLLVQTEAADRLNWLAIALGAGYYDQAHMINECRSLTGLSPSELIER